jgi:hypothetical protein
MKVEVAALQLHLKCIEVLITGMFLYIFFKSMSAEMSVNSSYCFINKFCRVTEQMGFITTENLPPQVNTILCSLYVL